MKHAFCGVCGIATLYSHCVHVCVCVCVCVSVCVCVCDMSCHCRCSSLELALKNACHFLSQVSALVCMYVCGVVCACMSLYINVPPHSLEWLVCPEYLAKGSLKRILHDRGEEVPWDLRLRALHDTASGMAYLHSQSPPAIHRDLKSGKGEWWK